MGNFLKTQYAFSNGEIAPEFYALDNSNGVSKLENMDVLQSGGLKRRPGLKRIKNVSANSILVPFVISESEKYLLAIYDSAIDVFQNDEKITTLVAPWYASDLKKLQYAQRFNQIFFVHPDYGPKILTKTNAGFSVASFNFAINTDVSINIPFMRFEDTQNITITITNSNIDNNFGEYQGLIYDGAYSEHIESAEKKGLVGEDIDEEKAKQIATDFIGNDRIVKLESLGFIENGDIPVYEFSVSIKDGNPNNPANISIAKKGGHIVLMNYNREIQAEVLSFEQADEIGKNFLESRGIESMKSTYYLKQGGSITINYAYTQDNITVYPDLIKLKIALDNGEILGFETSGYLNNHTARNIETPKIGIDEAKENLNKNLEITSEGLAIIPTEWKTEILCYEFKGKINGTDFLVYVNANTGREEDILVIINTPNGVLTQ